MKYIYIYIFFWGGGGGGDKVAELETGVFVTGGLPGVVSNFCCIRLKESLSMYSLDHPGLGKVQEIQPETVLFGSNTSSE